MQRTLALVALFLPLEWGTPLAAQEKPHEALIEQSIKLLMQVTATLKGVDDAAKAEAARPELRKLATQWQELRKQAAELPPPDRAEKDRLAKEYQKGLIAAERGLREQTIRLETVEGGRLALQEIAGILKKVGP